MRALAVLLLASAACGGDETYILVTVDKRPAVHEPETLEVTLSNDSSMYSQTLDLDGHAFPVTFSISAPGRSGDLGITIDAIDGMETLVGRGVGTLSLDSPSAVVVLDSADFVVNSEYANDQFLTDDLETVGFQLAATSDGTWMATYRDACDANGDCQVYGRRFDATGLPVFSQIAAGDIAFKLTTGATTVYTTSAVAASGTAMAAFWDYENVTDLARGIACRPLDATGASTTDPVSVASGSTDVVSASGLSGGNYAVVWSDMDTTPVSIRGAIVSSSCAPLAGSPFVVSPPGAAVGTFGARRAHVASNGNVALFAWITDDDLWIRTGSAAGPSGPEMKIVTKTASQTIEYVRVSPWDTGFAVATRWKSSAVDGPGKIEIYRVSSTGIVMGSPIVVTDRSGSDYPSNKGFSIAEGADHSIFVAWHVCETGPGLCDVFGRLYRSSGDAAGEAFVVPTSTTSEQTNPSVVSVGDSFVVAWNDSSGEAPDSSGTAVRARVITPP